MFRQALAVAREFTRPVVLSRKTVGGVCSSAIGTFVVINREGWIITAGHMLQHLEALGLGDQKRRAYETEYATIKNDFIH